jgi:hypothetical protein
MDGLIFTFDQVVAILIIAVAFGIAAAMFDSIKEAKEDKHV